MEQQLNFTKEEVVESGTWICQVDDGTIFYWKYTTPKRLYVKWNGEIISAVLPEDDMFYKGVHENALYLCSKEKIYKAVFTPFVGLKVINLRNQIDGEELYVGGLCSRVREGRTYVYRMFEDPARDGLDVNLPQESLAQIELRLFHRGKAIYVSKNVEASIPTVTKLKENVIVIEMRYEYSIFARDSSHFLYIAGSDHVYTLDTITMEFLPPLRTNNIELHSIAGVHDDMITVDATVGNEIFLMTARLPEEYVENTVTVNGQTITIDVLVDRYKDMETLLKDVLEGSDEQKKKNNKEEELKNTIADLHKIIDDLINEKEMIKRVDEARLTELKMLINQLERKEVEMLRTINDLRTENLKTHEESHQIQQLRVDYLELQSRSAGFAHEKEILQQANEKLQVTISELINGKHRNLTANEDEQAELRRKIVLLSQEKEQIERKCDEDRAELQRHNMEISLENELLRKQYNAEKAELERQLADLAHQNEVLKRQNAGETMELRTEHADLLREFNRMGTAHGEEIAELNQKIQELQEEMSEMIHERDSLDNAERSNVELNMRRLRERIHELTVENKNQNDKFKEEKDQLNMIIRLQHRNLEKGETIAKVMNENHRLKNEENKKVILELRKRLSHNEHSRVSKVSETDVDEEDERTKHIHQFLAEIKQFDQSEEKLEEIIEETRPSSFHTQIAKPNVETISESSSKLSKAEHPEQSQELFPIPNDPTSPPPSPPPAPPPPPPFPSSLLTSPSLARTPLKFTSRALDSERATSTDTPENSSPVTSSAEARSNLMSELQATLRLREAVLEQARAGKVEVSSIVRKSIRGRSKSAHRSLNSDD